MHRGVTLVLQTILVVGTGLAVWQGQWLAALTTAAILVVTLLPLLSSRRLRVSATEFAALTTVFVSARASSSPTC